MLRTSDLKTSMKKAKQMLDSERSEVRLRSASPLQSDPRKYEKLQESGDKEN